MDNAEAQFTAALQVSFISSLFRPLHTTQTSKNELRQRPTVASCHVSSVRTKKTDALEHTHMFCACVKEEYLSADILTAVKVKRQFFDNALTNNVTPNGEYVVISEDTS